MSTLNCSSSKTGGAQSVVVRQMRHLEDGLLLTGIPSVFTATTTTPLDLREVCYAALVTLLWDCFRMTQKSWGLR